MMKNLKKEWREKVKGKDLFKGCVDELKWLMKDRDGWISEIVINDWLIKVIKIVM